jgi:ribosomal protein S10
MELKRTQNSVRLESFNHEILVSSCQKIVNILQNTSLNSGVIALPTRKRIYCVLRSLTWIKMQSILKLEFTSEF